MANVLVYCVRSVVFDQMLSTDEHSNVLIYMNGHGGDQFLKFHDMEEVSSHDLGGALREMELKKRYHRVSAAWPLYDA